MQKNYPMIGLLMATMLEAKPFVKELSLRKYEQKPFEIYGNEKLLLIISGIGKTNAAAACAYLILKKNPSCICNLGAAGAMGEEHALGNIYHISKVTEPDRPELKSGMPHEHMPDTLLTPLVPPQGISQISPAGDVAFPTAILATQDRPMKNPEERKAIAQTAHLADMEGAAVVQTCRRFHTKCCLFKFVSDTPLEHSIVSNIRLCRDDFCAFFCKSALPALLSANQIFSS